MVADDQLGRSDSGREEFEPFFRREFPALVGIVIKAGFSRDDALDAAEDAMVQACARWDRVRDPRAWVRTVALRKAIAAARRRREEVQRAVRAGWISTGRDDRELVAEVDERTRVAALLALLPDKQRFVMVLHMEGFKTDEIGDALGMRPATVRSHLRHARERLRNAIGKSDDGGREVG